MPKMARSSAHEAWFAATMVRSRGMTGRAVARVTASLSMGCTVPLVKDTRYRCSETLGFLCSETLGFLDQRRAAP